MIRFEYTGPAAPFLNRKLLNQSITEFHQAAIKAIEKPSAQSQWTIYLEDTLLFDNGGLALLRDAVKNYRGEATTLLFELQLSEAIYRNYYSLGEPRTPRGTITLPVKAVRANGGNIEEIITVSFKYTVSEYVQFPDSLAKSEHMETPTQLLSVYHGEYDLLFANQMLIFAHLAKQIKFSPRAWLGLLTKRHVKSKTKRISLAYKNIHPSAQIHPTAVIEGAAIGEGAVIGAHCVVRYSYIGKHAQLKDGAKVEFSIVGDRSCLMHDLVLLRSHVEDDVFLIHGPYQFSLFMSHSAAFATIMMDYRADNKPIKVMTENGLREYQGRFLGAVLKEYAKSLGGSLLAPGMIVPEKTWLSCDLSQVHKNPTNVSEQFKAIPPLKAAK